MDIPHFTDDCKLFIRFSRDSVKNMNSYESKIFTFHGSMKVPGAIVSFWHNSLGQFTRNYTQTTKRGLLTTKQAEHQAQEKCEVFSLFCCPGFPKGLAPWHTTLLAKCSVLYALSALLRKWGCRRVGQGHLKQQENRAVIACRGAASAGLVSSADRAYMKAPVPRPTPDFGTKCPELVDTLTKKQTHFSLKIGMGGEAILGLCYLPDKWEVKFRPYIFLPRCIHDFLHKQTTLIFWYSQIYFRLNLRPMLFRWKFYFQRLAYTRWLHGFDKTLHHHLKTVELMKFEKMVLLKKQ